MLVHAYVSRALYFKLIIHLQLIVVIMTIKLCVLYLQINVLKCNQLDFTRRMHYATWQFAVQTGRKASAYSRLFGVDLKRGTFPSHFAALLPKRRGKDAVQARKKWCHTYAEDALKRRQCRNCFATCRSGGG